MQAISYPEGQPILIDTGAEVSCIDPKLVGQWQWKQQGMQSYEGIGDKKGNAYLWSGPLRLLDKEGKPLFIGQCQLLGIELPKPFKLLLGMDVLRRHKANIMISGSESISLIDINGLRRMIRTVPSINIEVPRIETLHRSKKQPSKSNPGRGDWGLSDEIQKGFNNMANSCELEGDDREELMNLLFEFKDVWAAPKLGCYTGSEFEISLKPNTEPTKHQVRRQTPEDIKTIDEFYQKGLEEGIFERSTSAWASGIVMVQKKDGRRHPAVDYRDVNRKTLNTYRFPIPRIDGSISSLGDEIEDDRRSWKGGGEKRVIFAAIDLFRGYLQTIPTKETSKIMAQIYEGGHVNPKCNPYGPTGMPGFFQSEMMKSFAELDKKKIYLDDILLWGITPKQLLSRLRKFLTICRDKGLYISIKKSIIGAKQVEYLGWVIDENGVRAQDRRLKELSELPNPTTIGEVRRFCGLANFLSRTVPMFANLLAPFTELLRGKPKSRHVKIEWNESLEEARQKLQDGLRKQVKRSFYRENCPLELYTDASETAIGAILYQWQDGERVILDIHSEKLTDTQRRWDARERECWAIVRHMMLWRFWTITMKVSIFTDHKSLQWLMNSKNASSKLQRWQLALQEFEFEIHYLPGDSNEGADYFSRSIPKYDDDTEVENIFRCVEDETVPQTHKSGRIAVVRSALSTSGGQQIMLPEETKVKGMQRDITGRKIPFRFDLQEPPVFELPTEIELIREQENERSQHQLPDSLIYSSQMKLYLWRPRKGWGRIYVPVSLRTRVLRAIHWKGVVAHRGIQVTRDTVAKVFYWPGLRQDVENYVNSCLVCKRWRGVKKQGSTSVIRSAPHEVIAIDHIEINDGRGCKQKFLTVIDLFTRYMQVYHVRDAGTDEVIRVLRGGWLKHFPSPLAVLHDGGPAFRSSKWDSYVKLTGMTHYSAFRYYPQGNGIIESAHRTIKESMRIQWESDFQTTPETASTRASAVHNALPNRSTTISPYHAMFGIDVVDIEVRKLLQLDNLTATEWGQRTALLWSFMRKRAQDLCEVTNQQYRTIKVGDWITRHRPKEERKYINRRSHTWSKEVPKCHWPMRVTKVQTTSLEAIDLRTGSIEVIPRSAVSLISIPEDGTIEDIGILATSSHEVEALENAVKPQNRNRYVRKKQEEDS